MFAPENALSAIAPELLKTPLYDLHLELGARMVPFAGYAMPVQYPAGLMAEHHHTRQAAGLFDVSHMGQLRLVGAGAAAALETLIPVDVIDLPAGKQRYGLLLNEDGGIIDDLMFFNRDYLNGGDIFVIVNGACKVGDIAHIQANIGTRCEVIPMPDMALLALQGPQAVTALSRLAPVAMHFGIDPVHFGLVMVVNLALGMITPPFGVNLFAACTVARISLDRIVGHLIPFVLVILACLMVITYFPAIALTLRDLVYAK